MRACNSQELQASQYSQLSPPRILSFSPNHGSSRLFLYVVSWYSSLSLSLSNSLALSSTLCSDTALSVFVPAFLPLALSVPLHPSQCQYQ